MKRITYVFIFTFFLFCCFHRGIVKKQEKTLRELTIDTPIYVEVRGKEIFSYDDETLFKKAEEALDNDELDKGIYFYYLLLQKFPNSKLVPATLYNIGATYEDKKDTDKAIRFYKYLVEHYPNNILVPRALFRIALLEEKEGNYRDALEVIRKLEKFNLKSEDKLKLKVLKGVTLVDLGDNTKGRELLEEADEEYTRKYLHGEKVDRYFWGWARFMEGEILFREFNSYHITGITKEELKPQISKKADLLLSALRLYFRTLKTHSMHWATAAVYRMGLLYELFYVEIASIKPPPSLNNEEKEVYFEELDKELQPVKKKAIEIYEKIIHYAEQWGIKTEWIRKAEEHLEILKSFKIFPPKG